ncbi:ABC transporter permease [Acrocarpospora macrocephala]|uniref:Peptide ABC transporter permease n=1 Tax=Acrocarpospora macrocephala TaxID=150177 RepID=A0A5M3WKR5_9ACTN|nr:ABC transporter permease [Acrocarpospora macrocephala]GES09484.1 peptide ABC transporter permease [Acrocarpospora macrocephala]
MNYALLKLGRALIVVWGAFTASFILLYLMPASPIELLFPPNERASIDPQAFKEMEHAYGFDRPAWQQYVDRLLAALHGDFGTSVGTGQPVIKAIGEALPNTVILAACALVLASLFALSIAWVATYLESARLRNLISSVPPLLVSFPSFLLGLIIIKVFSFQLGWFPPISGEGLRGLVLPAVALAIPVSGPIAQLLLRNFQTEYASPYVLTSYSKGTRKGKVLNTEVLRNASLPALTQGGIIVGELLAGAVITETIFSRAGIGRLTEDAVRAQDVPIVQGIVMLVAVCFVTVNFIVDVSYPLVDPRLKAVSKGVTA